MYDRDYRAEGWGPEDLDEQNRRDADTWTVRERQHATRCACPAVDRNDCSATRYPETDPDGDEPCECSCHDPLDDD